MGNVHFSGRHRDVPNYAMTSPKDNVFEKNNVRFHIDGHYLTDFSDKGIKKFIEKHYNDKTGFLGGLGLGWGGKDLEFKEVKAFIQAAAANAENVKGMTFDLTDPQLGLFDDDDVKVQDIRHSFTMNYKPVNGTAADTEVSFVDATSVRYDARDARKAESRAENLFKTEQKTHRDLQKNLQNATKNRDKIADRIGDNAMRRLAEIDSKLEGFDQQIADLDTDLSSARGRLSQSHISDSEKRELRLMIRGMEAEKKELVDDRKKISKELTEKHGFWSFLGGGSTLEDLRKANKEVESARKALEAHRPDYDLAQDHWQEAKRKREAVERGESLADLNAPQEPPAPPADAPDTATETPAEPPAAQPEAPVDGPAASPGAQPPAAVQTEQAEQKLNEILNLPPAQQLEALRAIPADQQASFLKLADGYIQAGRSDNPLGLDAKNFQDLSALRDTISGIRLNALLLWDPTVQDAYLAQADEASKREILQQLEQQRFDQQLQAQAATLRQKLQSVPPEEEVIAPPAEAPVAGQAPAEAPAGPVAQASPLQRFQGLPTAEKLAAFESLSPADQDLAFTTLQPQEQSQLLLQMAAKTTGDTSALQRLTQLMSPDQKQALVNQLDETRRGIAGSPHELNTQVNLLLGVFAQQGVTPQPAAQTAAPGTEVITGERPVVREEAAPPTSQPTADQMAQQLSEMDPIMRMQSFVGLSQADKLAVFNKVPNLQARTEMLLALAYPVSHTADRNAIIGSLNPGQKQEIAELYRQGIPAAQEADPELATAMRTLVQELGATAAAAPVVAPTSQPTAAVVEEQPAVMAAPEAPVVASTAPAPVTAPVVEEQPVVQPQPPAPQAQQPTAQELVAALMALAPEERLGTFAGLELAQKQAIFSAVPVEARVELLLTQVYPEPQDADRAALIGSLKANEKQAMNQLYQQGQAAAAQVDPELGAAMQKLIQELGGQLAPAAQPAPLAQVQPQAQPAPAPVLEAAPQPVQPAAPQPVQQSPEPQRLDMSPQLRELKQVLGQKTWTGAIANKGRMTELADQIWAGTTANRKELAKTLVEAGQAQTLGLLFASVQVKPEETVEILASPGFPTQRFMKDIDDDRSYIMLYNLAQASTKSDSLGQRATAILNDTVKAYQSWMDREGPFKRLKASAEGEGFWSKVPKSVQDSVNNMFNTWWN